MEKTITIPENVEFNVDGNTITLKGEKGESSRVFEHPHISISNKDGIILKTESTKRKDTAIMGTWKAHINNMIVGVTKGYTYKMKIVYVHFPMTVKLDGDKVLINNFMGEKGVRTANVIGTAQVKIQKEDIELTGVNKEDLGQTAGNIERACKKKKKDVRVFHDGIYIVQKG